MEETRQIDYIIAREIYKIDYSNPPFSKYKGEWGRWVWDYDRTQGFNYAVPAYTSYLPLALELFNFVVSKTPEKFYLLSLKFDLLRDKHQITLIGPEGRIADCDLEDIPCWIAKKALEIHRELSNV